MRKIYLGDVFSNTNMALVVTPVDPFPHEGLSFVSLPGHRFHVRTSSRFTDLFNEKSSRFIALSMLYSHMCQKHHFTSIYFSTHSRPPAIPTRRVLLSASLTIPKHLNVILP